MTKLESKYLEYWGISKKLRICLNFAMDAEKQAKRARKNALEYAKEMEEFSWDGLLDEQGG